MAYLKSPESPSEQSQCHAECCLIVILRLQCYTCCGFLPPFWSCTMQANIQKVWNYSDWKNVNMCLNYDLKIVLECTISWRGIILQWWWSYGGQLVSLSFWSDLITGCRCKVSREPQCCNQIGHRRRCPHYIYIHICICQRGTISK